MVLAAEPNDVQLHLCVDLIGLGITNPNSVQKELNVKHPPNIDISYEYVTIENNVNITTVITHHLLLIHIELEVDRLLK